MREIEVTIEEIAFGGSGVGRTPEGKAVFVPFTIDGERVRARIVREKRQFAEAEIADVIEASAHRVEPRCPYFGRCGGCAYQHINYEHQLATKARQVEQTLRRIAKLDHVPMRPIVPSPNEYAYRNRVTVHVEQGVIGFYRRASRRLIDVVHCPISRDGVNAALGRLRQRRPRDGNYTLVDEKVQRGGGSVPDALFFEQVNDGVATALRELVASFFPQRGALLVDAFCGAGFFAKRLAANFDHVIGIERDRRAIRSAEANAAPNEFYICGDVDVHLREVLQRYCNAALIVDPPAAGLGEEARAAIRDSPPQTFVYVSCDPATLARDLGQLRSQFRISSVTPLDMFPQTAEIEVAVHLERVDAHRNG